ncbi:DUF1127 domain-containing protein [uncultured Desulfobacter sp.]|uniref:DUF1127 domain-containing protein n=1 Tax=uncultured Desulfobacter sp. TaxID=240139 RepID=UPI002AA6B3B8|nr:DUF1127 domain-containing protein [uncultured Desulfobacter sp.]
MSFGKKWVQASFRSIKRCFDWIRNIIKQVWQGFRHWKMSKKHCRLLLEMNDYLLKDIGISRADAVRFSRQRDSLWKCIFNKINAGRSGDMQI